MAKRNGKWKQSWIADCRNSAGERGNLAVPSEVVRISKGGSHLATGRGCGQCKRRGGGLPCPIPEETRPEALRTQTHSIKVTTQGGHGRRKALGFGGLVSFV